MKVTTLVLNGKGEPHFEAIDNLNTEQLISLAKEREQLARDKGMEWTMGAVTFYGSEVVHAVNSGELRDVSMAVTNMVMATRLLDFLYCGVTADQYRKSDFKFVITDDGAIAHTRLPAVS